MGSNAQHILIIAEESATGGALSAAIKARGYTCALARDTEDALDLIDEKTPLLVLVAGESVRRTGDITRELKKKRDLPVIALLAKRTFTDADGYLNAADDFILQPCDPKELNLRIKRILYKNGHGDSDKKIGGGNLSIDPSRGEVTVAGKTVELTFREYELLRFLAANPGRVFTRDAAHLFSRQ